MVSVFPANETDFSTNGIKALTCISAIVSEEINGEYSLQAEIPLTESVENGTILKTNTPKGKQLFRIYNISPNITGGTVIYARHIFYDLLDDFIEDKRPSGDGNAAVLSILDGTGFAGVSDITTENRATYQMTNPVKALIGDGNSFVNRWGGEIERDNFTVRMLERVGADRNATIRYRKNLTGLECSTDISGVVTRIYPTGRKADGQTLLTLPEKYIDSPLINNYARIKTARVDYPDIKVVTEAGEGESIVTEAQALERLRQAAKKEFENGADLPEFTGKVEFLPLQDTEEYKNLSALEKVYIGDSVTVYYEPLSIGLSARVMAYSYDALGGRYESVTLGCVRPLAGTLGSTLGQYLQSVDDAHSEEESKIRQEFVAADGELRSAIEDTETGLSSEIEQTAEQLTISFTNADKGLESQITQTAAEITARVQDNEDNISTLSQTATKIETNVKNLEDDTASQFKQTATEISTKVSKGEIASTINQTAQSVKIQAGKIDLTGYVTMTNLSTAGQTTINGGSITTGTIDAAKVAVKNLKADSITSGTLDASKVTVNNLDASKITTGKLSADRIDVDNISIDRISLSSSNYIKISSAYGPVSLDLYSGSSYRGGLCYDSSKGTTLRAWSLGTGKVTLDADRIDITGTLYYGGYRVVWKDVSINGTNYKILVNA